MELEHISKKVKAALYYEKHSCGKHAYFKALRKKVHCINVLKFTWIIFWLRRLDFIVEQIVL